MSHFGGRFTGLAASATAVALLLAAGTGAKTAPKVIAVGSMVGAKLAYVQTQATAPPSLFVSITTKPGQKVGLSWYVICSKNAPSVAVGSGAVYSKGVVAKGGKVSVTAPASVRLPLTIRSPKWCSISAYAFLTTATKSTQFLLGEG